MASQVGVVAVLLCVISLHAIDARRLRYTVGAELEFLKEVQASETEEQSLGTVEQSVDSVATLERQEAVDGISSSDNESATSSPDHQEIHQAIKWKAMRRQGRSLQRSEGREEDDAFDSSKEKDVVEDVVVMDYAQPHRKPPIHNEKP